jgi:alpha-beta hydrolase superfamily lysophospholipase
MDAWPIDSDLRAYADVPPEPWAAVLLLHGFGEHAGRHALTMAALAQRGIAVYAYDHRGHGRSCRLRRVWMIRLPCAGRLLPHIPTCRYS